MATLADCLTPVCLLLLLTMRDGRIPQRCLATPPFPPRHPVLPLVIVVLPLIISVLLIGLVLFFLIVLLLARTLVPARPSPPLHSHGHTSCETIHRLPSAPPTHQPSTDRASRWSAQDGDGLQRDSLQRT